LISRLVNEIVLVSSIWTNIYQWIGSKKLLKWFIDVFEISCYIFIKSNYGKDDDGTMERDGENHDFYVFFSKSWSLVLFSICLLNLASFVYYQLLIIPLENKFVQSWPRITMIFWFMCLPLSCPFSFITYI
jgi:hypothetical protein